MLIKFKYKYLTVEDDPLHSVETICTVTHDLSRVDVGWALCSRKDTINKKKGRKTAFARAIQNWSKTMRTAFWQYYFSQHPKDKTK